jgi:3-oxoacyl-[acyl-carrier-protein] synthase II
VVRQLRVVITGLGAVSPNGIGKDAYWQALVEGRSGVSAITCFDPSPFPSKIAAEVKGFQPEAYVEPREAKRMSRATLLGIAAAKMAFEDAHVQVTDANRSRVGVGFSTTWGKADVYENEFKSYQDRGYRSIHPTMLVEMPSHGLSSHVSATLGASGVCGTLSTGCTSGLDIIQWGCQQIYLGHASVMIVGSAEALLAPFMMAVMSSVGALSCRNDEPEKASRPFEKNRDGLVMGEGAGALVLEEIEHAQERQASIYAEILGYANGREGTDLVRCDLRAPGMVQVIETAMYQSGVPKCQLDYISAHGNGMQDYDTAETNAIKTVFGDQAYNIPLSSVKSMIGQPFSAAGSLQTIAACLTLQHNLITPTINYDIPDPACDLDYVPHRARRARLRTALVHAHGLGGTDSALVLGKLSS